MSVGTSCAAMLCCVRIWGLDSKKTKEEKKGEADYHLSINNKIWKCWAWKGAYLLFSRAACVLIGYVNSSFRFRLEQLNSNIFFECDPQCQKM